MGNIPGMSEGPLRLTAGAPPAPQGSRELLGFCDRRIVVVRPAKTKVEYMPQTPVPADPKTIGEHKIKKRIEMRLTQALIAKQLGVARATVESLDRNEYRPLGRVRRAIVAWLGFDPEPR